MTSATFDPGRGAGQFELKIGQPAGRAVAVEAQMAKVIKAKVRQALELADAEVQVTAAEAKLEAAKARAASDVEEARAKAEKVIAKAEAAMAKAKAKVTKAEAKAAARVKKAQDKLDTRREQVRELGGGHTSASSPRK